MYKYIYFFQEHNERNAGSIEETSQNTLPDFQIFDANTFERSIDMNPKVI